MRLLRLDLERYGPFTDRVLAFRPRAALHVVYGPNEAGKSCSLAAVTDLFFGIEARTRFDFLHPMKDLRLGAEIEGRDGRRFSFRRRKGNKQTLMDAADAALADDALAPFIGNLTREVFCRAFGLDAEKLRSGAEDVLRSEGDVAASLMAAASGLRGLGDLRRALEDEASAIYADRKAGNRRFYQVLDRYNEAREQMKRLELREGDWKKLNAELEEQAQAVEAANRARAALAAERRQVERRMRLAPILRAIDLRRAEIAALGPLPDVAGGTAARLVQALAGLDTARQAQAEAAAALERSEADLRTITVDAALMAHADTIARLFADTTAYERDATDSVRVGRELEGFEAELAALATRLAAPLEADLAALQPSDAALAAARVLIEEGRALGEERRRLEAERRAEEEAAAALEAERQRSGITDPAPLRERHALLVPALQRLPDEARLRQESEAERIALAQAAARLHPPVAELARLAAAPLPGPETIARLRRELEGAEEAVRRAADAVTAALAEGQDARAVMEELSAGRPVPTPEAVAALRAARDGHWAGLRDALTGTAPPQPGALLSGIADFERALAEADRLSDARIADADRVAQHAQAAERLRRAESAERHARAQHEAATERRDRLAAEWHGLWEPAGITPLPPAEMAPWRASLEALFTRRERLIQLEAALAQAEKALAQAAPELMALAGALDIPAAGQPLGAVAARVEQKLAALSAAWDKARDLETRLADTAARLRRLEAAAGAAQQAREGWRQRWSAALSNLGLDVATAPDGVAAVIEAWREVPGILAQRDNRRGRVAGMQRNMARFREDAAALVAAVAPDLAATDPLAAIRTLSQRLTAARTAASRREEAARSRDARARDLEARAAAVAAAQQGLAALADQLGIASEDALPPLAERLAAREALEVEIRRQLAHLAEQSGGQDEDGVRADLDGFEEDAASARLAALEQEEESAHRRSQEAFAAREQAQARRAALEQGVGAERAAQQKRAAEAELTEAGREWAVLKVASLMIGTAIERHRAGQQDPLMMRAGALFAMLTGGAYSGLAQDYDENDAARLAGRRRDGSLVQVPGMSEGTRDQLYLALRLAYLEDYASRAEPAPFIGDDLFSSFDDGRTRNGIAALASISDRVQPILFTHHQHVVELARRELGSAADIVELG